jgi:hypothetical protein
MDYYKFYPSKGVSTRDLHFQGEVQLRKKFDTEDGYGIVAD